MRTSKFWANFRGSIILLAIGFLGLLYIEAYHQWANSLTKEASDSQGFRKYLLSVLAGENGPFGILYNIVHFSMAVLIMIAFIWGLALAIMIVLGGLDPDRTFFENVAEKIFGTLDHSKDSSEPAGLAIRFIAPVIGAGLLAGSVFSVSTSLVSLTRVSRDEIRQWEQVSNSLDRLQILWTSHTVTPPPPPPCEPTKADDLYPVFARYGGIVSDAWKQGERIEKGKIVVQQDCEALNREILKTNSELRRLQSLPASEDNPEDEDALDGLQVSRADQRLTRYTRLSKEGLVPSDFVDELASEAKIAKKKRLLALADWKRRKEDRSFSVDITKQWLDFLENLRKECSIKAPISGKVEKIVKKGAYASADPEHPVAWIRADP